MTFGGKILYEELSCVIVPMRICVVEENSSHVLIWFSVTVISR